MSVKITAVSGRAFYLPGNDMDTDRIIPARFLKCVTFEGLGANVFKDDRTQLGGKHPFDLPENQGRSILVVDSNFGSGSSREHAVPALTQWGIKAIIGLSFAEIFRGNAVGNGLVCVDVSPPVHRYILRNISSGKDRADELVVDLNVLEAGSPGKIEEAMWLSPCSIPESHRYMLTEGKWDSIVTALEAGDQIETIARTLPYMATVGV